MGNDMATWRDNSGRDWYWSLTPPLLKDIRRELPDVDILGLLSLQSREPWDKVAGDPLQIYDLAWLLSRKQAEERSVTEEQFGREFVGDAFTRAEVAIVETLADFSPAGKRSLLQHLARQVRNQMETQEKAIQQALADLNASTESSEPVTSLPAS